MSAVVGAFTGVLWSFIRVVRIDQSSVLACYFRIAITCCGTMSSARTMARATSATKTATGVGDITEWRVVGSVGAVL